MFSCKYRVSRRTNTYAWIIATATSRIVRRSKIIAVRADTAGRIGRRTITAVEMSWISRCPAVRFAVRRTPRARGRMSRLVVSIRMRAGINGVGVPSGRRCPKEVEGWFRRPVRRVAIQSGKASAMFMDSWVVGVNVYGSRPSRLIVRSIVIREVRIRAHLWPFLFNGVSNCFVVVFKNHSCRVDKRLVIHRLLGVGSRRAGNRTDSRVRGTPRRHGLMNWSKKLKFMVRFMVKS